MDPPGAAEGNNLLRNTPRFHAPARTIAAAAVAILVLVVPSPVAAAAPPFKLPFICGEKYVGSTYSGHGYAIDFNQSYNADARDPVLASADGTVTETKYATSNGQITISQGGGWQTKYAHMSRVAVTQNQTVTRGRLLGYVDDVGHSYGEHLHYEQNLNGARVHSRFDGVLYTHGTAITSTLCSDTTPPSRTAPNPGFRVGTTVRTSGGTVPVRNTWSVSDAASGIKHSVLERKTNGGSYGLAASSTHPSSPSVSSYLTPSDTWLRTHRVRATDNAGNVSTDAAGATFRIRVFEDNVTAPDLTYTGTGWKTSTDTTNYSGGTVRRASTAGNSVTLSQNGHDLAIVATRGPHKGKFQVYVDGTAGAVVDLYSATTAYRQVVWQIGYSSAASHTVELRVLGQKNSSSSSTSVDVDAFLVLQP